MEKMACLEKLEYVFWEKVIEFRWNFEKNSKFLPVCILTSLCLLIIEAVLIRCNCVYIFYEKFLILNSSREI